MFSNPSFSGSSLPLPISLPISPRPYQKMCTIQGHASLYGLGIRLTLYILWVLTILSDLVFSSSSIHPSDHWKAHNIAHFVKFITFLIEIAVFVALLLHSNDLDVDASEKYLLWLLVTGRLLFHVPVYLLMLLTWFMCCGKRRRGKYDLMRLRGEWYDDGERRYSTKENGLWMACRFAFLLAVCGYGFWFWIQGVEIQTMGMGRCERYAFGLGQVQLAGDGMEVWCMLVLACLTAGAVLAMFRFAGRELDGESKWRYKQALSLGRYDFLRYLRAIFHSAVAATVIAAVEMTIQWNDIVGVNDVDTSAQLIPLICTIIVAIWWILDSFDLFSDSGSNWWGYGRHSSRWRDDSGYTSSFTCSTESGSSWYEGTHRRGRSPVDPTGALEVDIAPLPTPPEDAHLGG